MNTRTRVMLVVSLTITSAAYAQIDCPLLSAGGAAHPDGALFALGQLAIGPVASATQELQQGAIPCWLPLAEGCPGDLDGDGVIDLDDLATIFSNYGTASGATPEDGDIDGDGDVDLLDLAYVISEFGVPCN